MAAFLLCLPFSIWAAETSITLDQPVAFCLTPLEQCTQDKYQAVTDEVNYDIRHLNGGKNDPITLVYAVPKELEGQ